MGASGWNYYVAYQPDLQVALDELRRHVFEAGDYWWAARYEFGKSAADYPDRLRDEAELWADESVQESGTHSILDMTRVVANGEEPDYGTVQPVTEAEAVEGGRCQADSGACRGAGAARRAALVWPVRGLA